jgi:integrative and conjugative element protein (TIGR02256 family)
MILNKPDLVFQRIHTGNIKISLEALKRMAKFSQTAPDASEAGGVLLGRFIINSDDIVIDEVTIPHKGDRRGRFSFVRNAVSHQKVIEKKWVQSCGTCNYLGEWHTHPEAVPLPSSRDINDWKRILREAKFYSESLFFVIVGTELVSVWEGFKESLEIKPLAQGGTQNV